MAQVDVLLCEGQTEPQTLWYNIIITALILLSNPLIIISVDYNYSGMPEEHEQMEEKLQSKLLYTVIIMPI